MEADKKHPSSKEHPADLILRAAKLEGFPKKQDTKNIENTSLIEDIGLLLRVLRRQKGNTLDEFSDFLRIEPEELLALEAGILPKEKVCQILPPALKRAGIVLEPMQTRLRVLREIL